MTAIVTIDDPQVSVEVSLSNVVIEVPSNAVTVDVTPGAGGTDHTALSNIGSNTHTQIDTHIGSTANPHSTTAAKVGALPVAGGTMSAAATITYTDSVSLKSATPNVSSPVGHIFDTTNVFTGTHTLISVKTGGLEKLKIYNAVDGINGYSVVFENPVASGAFWFKSASANPVYKFGSPTGYFTVNVTGGAFESSSTTMSFAPVGQAVLKVNNVASVYSIDPHDSGTIIGSVSTKKWAFWGATPIARPSSTGETIGYFHIASTGVHSSSTFTGNVGTKAYTLNDIVKHLKNIGLIES